MKNTKEIHERERGRRESSNGQPNKPMSNPSDNLPLSLQSFLAALEHGKLRTLALRNLADCLLLHGLDLKSVSPNLQLGIPRCRMLSFSCLLDKHKMSAFLSCGTAVHHSLLDVFCHNSCRLRFTTPNTSKSLNWATASRADLHCLGLHGLGLHSAALHCLQSRSSVKRLPSCRSVIWRWVLGNAADL